MHVYSLDGSEEGLKGRKLAVTNPEEYELKPQREGGGSNIFPKFLAGMDNLGLDWTGPTFRFGLGLGPRGLDQSVGPRLD